MWPMALTVEMRWYACNTADVVCTHRLLVFSLHAAMFRLLMSLTRVPIWARRDLLCMAPTWSLRLVLLPP